MLLGSLGRADSRGGVGMSAHNHHHRLHHLEDDVYEDFSSPFPGAMIGSGGFSGTPAATAMKGPGTALGRGGLAPQMGFNGAAPGTALRTGEARPMTSVAGAGYHSKRTPGQFDPLKQKIRAEALAEKADNSPEDMAKEMELQTHRLIEHSAAAMVKGDATIALERAKEADKKEKALCRHREKHNLIEQINLDLTYAVCFNLAHCYHVNGMFKEALREYNAIVKNKQYPQAGRLRANIGNIYFEQRDYLEAVKNYRMALDQIPNTGKEVRFKIFRNIGTAFVRMGQYQDAIGSYEAVMGGCPDFQTGFNLLLCYYALEDVTQMKKAFQRLVAIPVHGLTGDDEADDESKDEREAEVIGETVVDGLREELRKRQKEGEKYILSAAKLMAPILDSRDWEVGFDWVVDTLKADHEHLASQMEIEKALQYLKDKQYDKAIEYLKAFEKKDQHLRAMAATNLSFMYFLEGEFRNADTYADLAIRHDRYNAKALVNKGNCLFMAKEFNRAKEIYLEAIGVEVDCVEAIFNLGLANIQLGLVGDAIQAFEKLHSLLPNNSEVIYHIANLFEAHREDLATASKWFNLLLARVPTDPGILARLGQIANREGDESQAFHYHMESYRHYPANLDVISWLGVWYVKSELYEKAIHFFERAGQIQPNEVKWQLMVTSCYRRMGNYQKALELYERIHVTHPDNLECLRYLVALCADMGRPHEHYQQKLARLDRSSQHQVPAPVRQGSSKLAASDTGGASPSLAEGDESECGSPGFTAPNARTFQKSSIGSPNAGVRDEVEFGNVDIGSLLA